MTKGQRAFVREWVIVLGFTALCWGGLIYGLSRLMDHLYR